MIPENKFKDQTKDFWANVRLLSQDLGYTNRGEGTVKVPTVDAIAKCLEKRSLTSSHLCDSKQVPTSMGKTLIEYFVYRAHVLEDYVEPRLMDATRAKKAFHALKKSLKPKCPLPMNKQKGAKRAKAYLTCIVNMIVEANVKGLPCDYDPRELTTIVHDGAPLRTLARRVDGAFPSPLNPLAVWEIKEYYYTTTFGSRVADGVYETLLDGMELEELRNAERIDVQHLLMIDAHYTWWDCGKSYLCRMIDMLHMGYVDEVLFGYEVIERLPMIVRDWVERYNALAK